MIVNKKILFLFLLALIASAFLFGCDDTTPVEDMPTEKTYSLLSDLSFQNGLGVISADHSLYDGTYSAELNLYEKTGDTAPIWYINQFDSRHDFANASHFKYDYGDGVYGYEDEFRSLSIDTATGKITIGLDSSLEFDGQRKADENYAYMLLSNAGSMRVPVKNLTTLMLDLNVSINRAKLENREAYDDTLHDAQCVFYLYLEDSVSGEKMNLCIFVYDYKQRATWIGNYNWEDPDTGAYVYSLDTRELYDYNTPRHRDIDTDLISYLMAAFRSARNNGYMLRSSYANLVVTGVSFGWQNPGSFSCEAVLNSFDLVAYENGTETKLVTDYPLVTVNTTKNTDKPVHEFIKDLTKQHELGVSGTWVPYEIGTLNYGGRAKEGRSWFLIQRGTKFSLLDPDVKFSSPGEGIYRYTDESKMVLINTNDGSFELALDGRVEWPDRVRGEDDWCTPGLVMNAYPQETVWVKDLESLNFSFDFVIDYVSNWHTVMNFNHTHCALFDCYFWVQDSKSNSWFYVGVLMSSWSTEKYDPEFISVDADTGNTFVYIPAALDIHGLRIDPETHYDLDLDMIDFIRIAFDKAQERGHLKGVNFDDLYLTGSGLGWEISSRFNCKATVNDFNITYTLKDE